MISCQHKLTFLYLKHFIIQIIYLLKKNIKIGYYAVFSSTHKSSKNIKEFHLQLILSQSFSIID